MYLRRIGSISQVDRQSTIRRSSLKSALSPHTHHPSAELITGFAVGDLPLGPSLAVRLHVEVCEDCQSAVRRIEEAEGRLLQSLPGARLQAGALQRALDQVDASPAAAAPGSMVSNLPPGIQASPALARIGLGPPVHLTPDAWVAHLDAPRVGGWRTYLFCAPAETTLPPHDHLGVELIVVLEGGFHDGRHFVEGDFVENRPGFVHTMQVASAGRLVALISSGDAIAWRPEHREIGARLDI